jgi:hypothetical protein
MIKNIIPGGFQFGGPVSDRQNFLPPRDGGFCFGHLYFGHLDLFRVSVFKCRDFVLYLNGGLIFFFAVLRVLSGYFPGREFVSASTFINLAQPPFFMNSVCSSMVLKRSPDILEHSIS